MDQLPEISAETAVAWANTSPGDRDEAFSTAEREILNKIVAPTTTRKFAQATVTDVIGPANGDGGDVLADIAASLKRIADHVDPPSQAPATNGVAPQAVNRRPKKESPYLDIQQAADYLGISPKSMYGQVDRRNIVPLRGPRRTYRFTVEMLDEYLRRDRRKRQETEWRNLRAGRWSSRSVLPETASPRQLLSRLLSWR